MKLKSITLALLSLGIFSGAMMLGALPAQAGVNVDFVIGVPPPEPRVEHVPEPRDGFVWISGYWRWEGDRHVWTEGHWERERHGYEYRPAHWDRDGDNWRFRDGGWQERREEQREAERREEYREDRHEHRDHDRDHWEDHHDRDDR